MEDDEQETIGIDWNGGMNSNLSVGGGGKENETVKGRSSIRTPVQSIPAALGSVSSMETGQALDAKDPNIAIGRNGDDTGTTSKLM